MLHKDDFWLETSVSIGEECKNRTPEKLIMFTRTSHETINIKLFSNDGHCSIDVSQGKFNFIASLFGEK